LIRTPRPTLHTLIVQKKCVQSFFCLFLFQKDETVDIKFDKSYVSNYNQPKSWDSIGTNEYKRMKKVLLFLGCLCISLAANAQSYRGSDADRMMYERMRQHSQQNSGSNTYVPQRNYNNNSYSNNYQRQPRMPYSQPEVEKVIQGVYVYNGQLAVVRLRYYEGKITHVSTSRDMMGREQWQTIYPDTPRQTMSMVDGQLAREYKYKVSVSGTTVYFNM